MVCVNPLSFAYILSASRLGIDEFIKAGNRRLQEGWGVKGYVVPKCSEMLLKTERTAKIMPYKMKKYFEELQK
jgi:hypothetical protein